MDLAQEPNAKRKLIWGNILFFLAMGLGAFVGLPIYLHHFDLGLFDWLLFGFYMAATGLGITVGYHRLFAHQTYKAHPIVQFFLLFFGAAAFEQTAYNWATQHRDHHTYVDTERDPYTIKKGFWYAHIGWLVFWEHKMHYENTKDLARNPLVMHQHRYYFLWAIFSGIILPVLIGALWGNALGAFLLSVCARITLVYHSTFCINSVCHMFGKATYDIYSTAKDHWFIALLTYGEGYHNFHHRFPSDYRNAVQWYQWDPSKWTICLLEKMGLVYDLKRVSNFRILEARLAGEHRRIHDIFSGWKKHPQVVRATEQFMMQHQQLKTRLHAWEKASREYQEFLKERVHHQSAELQRAAFKKLEVARERFKQAHLHWQMLIEQPLPALQKKLLLAPAF